MLRDKTILLVCISLAGFFAEVCEDPIARPDILSIPIWHRALMFAAGACCVFVMRSEKQRTLLKQFYVGTFYVCAFFLTLLFLRLHVHSG